MFYWHSPFGLHTGNEVVSILSLQITQLSYGILVLHLSQAVLKRRTDGIVTANRLILLLIIVPFALYILTTYYVRLLLMVYLFMVMSSIYSEYKCQSNFCQREIWRPLYCHLALIRSSFVTIFKLLSCFFSKGQVDTSFLVRELFLLETLIDHGIRGSRFWSIYLFDYFQPASVWPVSFNRLCLHGICYVCSNMTSLLQMTVGHDYLRFWWYSCIDNSEK